MSKHGKRHVDRLVAEFTGSSKTGGLTAVQQDELNLKLRFGIGLEQAFGASVAASIRHDVKFLLSTARPVVEREQQAPEPSRTTVEARAAAMGVTAGRRGQWLRR
jgi:hypothetical protein